MRGGPNFKFFLPRVTTHFKYLLLRISCTASQVRGIVLQHIDFFSCAAAYYHLVCYKKLVAAHRAAPHCAAAYHFLVCCKTGGRAASSAEWCWSMLLLGLLHNRRALRGSSQDLLSSLLKNIEIFLPKYISPP
jgi:hypothetical protein